MNFNSSCTATPLERSISMSNFEIVGESKEAEYFFASDASAVIEHTNRVIYLEDNDVAAVQDGCEYITFCIHHPLWRSRPS